MRRRRRRRADDLVFSFDSFLDVVANVVGVVIRLILVVWVGAKSYTTWQQFVPPADAPPPEVAGPLPDLPPDPLEDDLVRQRRELEDAQARLLDQLRRLQQFDDEHAALNRELARAFEPRPSSPAAVAVVGSPEDDGSLQAANLSLEELRRRSRALVEELKALEKEPAPKQTLKARTPVSRPVKAEEVFFECKGGRVTFIDLQPMLDEVKRGLRQKGEELRSRPEVKDVTTPVGAYRLHYTVEREKSLLDGGGSFSYGVSGWEVEPLDPGRGETLEAATADRSAYRKVVDSIDPQMATVTFWVYPDSFALYRKLRDDLADRDVVVAGRPLPEDAPIASSRRGTSSRGQ
jgi:hypothetical protein